MRLRWKLWLGLACQSSVLTLAGSAAAAESNPSGPNRWRFGVELDPFPFISHGYSVHTVWKPGPAPRWRFTAGMFGQRGEGADNSSNAGFRYRLTGFETSASYYPFDRRGRGAFVGVYGFLRRFDLRYPGVSGQAARNVYSVGPAAGYQFLPWTNGPYVTPWISLAVPVATQGSKHVGSHRYHEKAVDLIWGLHFGGEFAAF